MKARDVIGIGNSADGFAALSRWVRILPPDFPASVFFVRHSSPDTPSSLPGLIQRAGRLTASHALHGDPIRPSHIFVAPPTSRRR